MLDNITSDRRTRTGTSILPFGNKVLCSLHSDKPHHWLCSFRRHPPLGLAGPNIPLSTHCVHNVSSCRGDVGKVHLHFHGFALRGAQLPGHIYPGSLDPPCHLPSGYISHRSAPWSVSTLYVLCKHSGGGASQLLQGTATPFLLRDRSRR